MSNLQLLGTTGRDCAVVYGRGDLVSHEVTKMETCRERSNVLVSYPLTFDMIQWFNEFIFQWRPFIASFALSLSILMKATSKKQGSI